MQEFLMSHDFPGMAVDLSRSCTKSPGLVDSHVYWMISMKVHFIGRHEIILYKSVHIAFQHYPGLMNNDNVPTLAVLNCQR